MAPAITGILYTADEDKADGMEEWTVEELQDAKPILLYYVRLNNTDPKLFEDEYNFSRRFEMGLQEKVLKRLNERWRCKKVALDLDTEYEKAEEMTRIEMWSSIETKMKVITAKKKDQKLLGGGPMARILRKYEKVNKTIVGKEIKRIEAREKALQKESASK